MCLGAIQQLRGQEEGEGVSQKSTFVHPGRGGPFNVHVDQNLTISESISLSLEAESVQMYYAD